MEKNLFSFTTLTSVALVKLKCVSLYTFISPGEAGDNSTTVLIGISATVWCMGCANSVNEKHGSHDPNYGDAFKF